MENPILVTPTQHRVGYINLWGQNVKLQNRQQCRGVQDKEEPPSLLRSRIIDDVIIFIIVFIIWRRGFVLTWDLCRVHSRPQLSQRDAAACMSYMIIE